MSQSPASETSDWHGLVLSELEALTFQLQQVHQLDQLEAALPHVVAIVHQLIGAERVLIWQYRAEHSGIVLAEVGAEPLQSLKGASSLIFSFESDWLDRYRQGEKRVINHQDQAVLPHQQAQWLGHLGVKSHLGVPILVAPSVSDQPGSTSTFWGLLVVQRCHSAQPWDAYSQNFLGQIALQIGGVVQRLALQDQLSSSQAQTGGLGIALTASVNGVWDWTLNSQHHAPDALLDRVWQPSASQGHSLIPDWLARVHPEDKAIVLAAMFSCLRGEAPEFSVEHRMATATGDYCWFLSRGVVQHRNNGRLHHFIGTHLDITDRKIAELAVARQHRQEQALGQVTRAIHSSLDLSQTFDLAVEQIADCVQSLAMIVQFLPDEGCWRPLALSKQRFGFAPLDETMLRMDIPDLGNPIAARLKRGEMLQLQGDEVLVSLAEAALAGQSDTFPDSWLLVPIMVEGQIWGSLSLAHGQRPLPWLEEDLVLAQRVVNKLAVAVHQANLYQQLQALYERNALVLQSIGEGIWDWNPTTNGVRVSARYWQILGYAPLITSHTTFEAEAERVHPADRNGTINALRQHLACNQRFDVEFRAQHRDGNYRWLRARGQAIWDSQGQPLRMVGTIENISDRKAAEAILKQREAEFRTLVENSPDGILRLNRQWQVVYINPTLVKKFASPDADLLGHPFLDLIAEAPLAQAWQTALTRAFNTHQEQQLDTSEQIGGEGHHFQSRIVPEKNAQGEVTSVLIVSQDVSSLKHTQALLMRRIEQEASLRVITQHMRQTLDLDAVLQNAVGKLRQALQADRALIFRFTSTQGGTIIRAATRPEYPFPKDMPWEDHCFPQNFRTAYRQNHGRIIPNVLEDPWGDCLVGFMKSIGVQSKMVATINQPHKQGLDTVWGLIIIHACSEPRQWQPDELALLQQVADQLAIALQQSALHQRLQAANNELERISNTDALTQVANRRSFNMLLQKELKRSRREQQPLALIFCDVDYFKQYNDTYGHPAGDACLTSVARALKGCLKRPADCLARYGGEEFAVTLPNTDAKGAFAIAQAMRLAVANLGITHQTHKSAEHVTLSFGITATVPTHSTTTQSLLRQADRALYKAKAAGRDRCAMDA